MRQCVINIGEIKQFKEQSYHSRRWTNLLDSTSMFSSVTPHSSLARAAAVGGVSLSAPLIRAVYCLRAHFIHILCLSLTHSPHWASRLLSEEFSLISFHKIEIQKHPEDIVPFPWRSAPDIPPSSCFLLWAVSVSFTTYSTICGAGCKPGPSSKGAVIWTWKHALLYKGRNPWSLSCLYRVLRFPRCPVTGITQYVTFSGCFSHPQFSLCI